MFLRLPALLCVVVAALLLVTSQSTCVFADHHEEAKTDASGSEHSESDHAEDGHGQSGHGSEGHGGEDHGGDHGHHDLGHGNAGAALESPAEFRSDLAIYTFAVFMLLLALLGKFAWPTISAALLEREKRIENNIAEAEAMNAEAKRMLAEHEAKLATAADEVRELLEEARRDAETTKSQILAEAKDAADKERERAIRDVEVAADKAMHKLAESSANMAVDWASKVAKQSITPERQAEIVREALGQLTSNSPSEN